MPPSGQAVARSGPVRDALEDAVGSTPLASEQNSQEEGSQRAHQR